MGRSSHCLAYPLTAFPCVALQFTSGASRLIRHEPDRALGVVRLGSQHGRGNAECKSVSALLGLDHEGSAWLGPFRAPRSMPHAYKLVQRLGDEELERLSRLPSVLSIEQDTNEGSRGSRFGRG